MTAAKTPSQRAAASRRKGRTAEQHLCNWLRDNGFPGAERAVRTGFRVTGRAGADPGDVTGTPGIVWSVKDVAVERIDKWLAELDAMHGPGAIRLLVHKRTGKADPGRWWCWLRLSTLVWLADGGQAILVRPGAEPVRMELGHVIFLLRAAGYGDPINETKETA